MSNTWTYCEKCGTYRFKPADELCWHCTPASEKRAVLAAKEAAAAVSPVQNLDTSITSGKAA